RLLVAAPLARTDRTRRGQCGGGSQERGEEGDKAFRWVTRDASGLFSSSPSPGGVLGSHTILLCSLRPVRNVVESCIFTGIRCMSHLNIIVGSCIYRCRSLWLCERNSVQLDK
ncbi:unnamed protein product, partial [Musa hybrid cultivar]